MGGQRLNGDSSVVVLALSIIALDREDKDLFLCLDFSVQPAFCVQANAWNGAQSHPASGAISIKKTFQIHKIRIFITAKV